MREQVLRIGHHPSVALWGGNNENEAAFGWCVTASLLKHPAAMLA
jgi:beta-galactosidase/beta-glucuronidase